MNKGIWLDVKKKTTAYSYWTDCNFKPFICLMRYDYFIFVCFRKVATPLFDRNKTLFEILLIDMAKKSLDKVNDNGDGICWNLCKRKCPYLLQSDRYQYTEPCSHWCYSDIGPYCDSNIKTGNETYASHFIFIYFNLERLWIQHISCHENESHFKPVLLDIINRSELTI